MRFSQSYAKFPPVFDHRMIVLCNKGNPTENVRGLFRDLPAHDYYLHDNTGWDVGGFRALARTLDCDLMVCFGSHVYFHRAGWLKRLAEAWTKHGDGMYGLFSSYAVRPHLNTTAFAITPCLLAAYQGRLDTKAERYEFEHGAWSLWRRVAALGYPTLLVTWDGEWAPPSWRMAPNIMWRGNQSNCLVWSKHTRSYAQGNQQLKFRMEQLADQNVRPRAVVA